MNAEDDAFEDGGVSAEDGFYGVGGGFASGDVEEVGGAALKEDESVANFRQVRGFKPGQQVQITYVRDGKESSVTVTLQEKK